MSRSRRIVELTCTTLLLLFAADPAAAREMTPYRDLARDLLAELVEIDTRVEHGDTTAAAEAMARRLQEAGFPEPDLFLGGPHPRQHNLVARYSGSGTRPPLLLLAHLDVVDARREDWSFEPFVFREEDGYFYGRGVSDNKDMAAIWVANLIRLRTEGFMPDRDIIVALTADEEGGDHNGVQWLLDRHRDLIAAELCLNEGGWGAMRDGRYLSNGIQPSEKIYMTLRVETTHPGGHSSVPRPDNAIYRLAAGLMRLAEFEFPVALDEVTRAYFGRSAEIEEGAIAAAMRGLAASPPDPAGIRTLSQVPYYNALMRTTCVATELDGGQAENALPQRARATINCRMLPTADPAWVRQTILEVLADDAISMSTTWEPVPSPPSPLLPSLMATVERITEEMWPGVPVIPVMLTGATDGLYLRNAGIPTYGISGIFHDLEDLRAHGRDERVGVKQFFAGQEFLYRLVKALSAS